MTTSIEYFHTNILNILSKLNIIIIVSNNNFDFSLAPTVNIFLHGFYLSNIIERSKIECFVTNFLSSVNLASFRTIVLVCFF